MIIIVAGIHGVGKSHLCMQYAKNPHVIYKSASDIIREKLKNLSGTNFSFTKNEKKVNDIDFNQKILLSEINKFNKEQTNKVLLLDGHLTLIDCENRIQRVTKSFFKEIDLRGIILLERDLDKINKMYPIYDLSKINLVEFEMQEKQYAKEIAQDHGVEIIELYEPDIEQFSSCVDLMVRRLIKNY